MIKTKNPISRKAAIFDTLDIIDVRFKKKNTSWEGNIKYYLTTNTGERSEEYFQDKLTVTDAEIKKMEKLIAKITDGDIGE